MKPKQVKQFWIMGPTASGKTSLALEYAKHFECEIISVDSALVYKGLKIGAAKPSEMEQQAIVHHLIDICEIWEIYDVAQFCRDAKIQIQSIEKKGKNPILIGGTFLYFRSLEQGLSKLPASDKSLQQKWQKLADEHGASYLHEKLKKVDEVTSEKLHPNDSQRIIRALVVFEQTGQSLSDWLAKENQQNEKQPSEKPIKIALLADREDLKQKIETRFLQMIEAGLVEEVQGLLSDLEQRGISAKNYSNYPALKSVGYKEVVQYLLGELSYDEMITKAIISTNQLAKRQRTWLRSEKNTLLFPDWSSALKSMLELSK